MSHQQQDEKPEQSTNTKEKDMTSNRKDPVLVVLQMSGAFDALNTVIPYNDPLYPDYRPVLKVDPEQVLDIDGNVGFHPSMSPLKELYDEGKVAVIQGIGYPNPNRSHFRSMDIWHTAEPEKMVTEGWLGKAIRDLDPHKENVLTAVNFGRGLPRALAAPGVSVASVGDLNNYGVLTGLDGEDQRMEALDIFARMYSPAIGTGPRQRLPVPDRLGCLEGRRHSEHRPVEVLFQRGVQRRLLHAVGEEHRPSPLGRLRHPGALHQPQPRLFRHPRQSEHRIPEDVV